MPSLTLPSAPESKRVNLRFLEPIWHIKGQVPLAPGQSRDEAFAKLSPLFFERGTSHERSGDTLKFSKKDPAAQDKMAVFNSGVLEITEGGAGGAASGGMLHYRLASNALLYCFLAPALFLSFAGLTIAAGRIDPPKEPTAAEKAKEEKKNAEPLPQHWIDKMLGAPIPEKPGSDKAETKAKAGAKDSKDKKKEDKEHSPKPAYIFAGIFAALYLAGRVLEDRLVKRLFLRKLREA